MNSGGTKVLSHGGKHRPNGAHWLLYDVH